MLSDLIAVEATPFAGMPYWAVASVFVVYGFGFFIRGAFGFGSNMPVVLLTTWLLGPHHAILLVLLASFVAQVHLFRQGIQTADWQVTRPLIVGLFAGIALGTWLFTAIAADWLTLILALLIVVIVMAERLRLLERLGTVVDLRSRALASSLAATSGIVGSVSGAGGIYFLVVYLKLACATPEKLRGTNVMVSGLMMIGRGTLLWAAGMFTPKLLIELALLIPVVVLGTWSGTRFYRGASAERFYAALQALLLVAAIALLAKALAQVF